MLTMTPRERFLAAVNHQEPDRVPIDLGSHVCSISRRAYINLQEHLADPALKNQDKILDRMTQNVIPDEKLLQRLGVDFRWIRVCPPDERPAEDVSDGSFRDEWGIIWQFADYNYSPVGSPLAKATVADLETFPWPNPYDPGRTRGLREYAKYLYENTNYVIMADTIKGGLFTTALWLRGYEQMLMDLGADPEFVDVLLDKLLWLFKELWGEYLKAVGPYVQVAFITDDFGSQDTTLVSPRMFRRVFKPRLEELIAHIKSLANVKLMYHTDGNVDPIIEDFVDMGVDILNPIQTSAMGMDTTVLKENFGDRLCFHGAIDVQEMLPFSTPEEVRLDLAKRIRDLGRSGGYILAPCHNIGPDVPPVNLLTMFEAAKEFGRYPL